MDQNATLAGIKKAAKAFNQGIIDALRDILGVDFATDYAQNFEHSTTFHTTHRTIVCLPFTGVVNGEFFLCLSAAHFAQQMSLVSGKGEDSAENRELLFSTMQEVVNIAAGGAMVAIKEIFGSQTMLSPRLLEGVLHYPRMQIFSSTLASSNAAVTIDAKLCVDLMEQDINIQQQKLQEKSIMDDTGLFNKKHFYEILKQYEQKAAAEKFDYTIVFTDINRLKYVNDNLGHDAGDNFIKTACSLLKQSEQGTGDKSFRIGGDELVMVLGGKTLEQAEEGVLKKMREMMATAKISAVNISSQKREEVEVHLSIGVASTSEGLVGAEKVLKQADLRMEEDKRQWYIDNKIDRRK
jgi:diguanylate cyclase (GGDEF)-like protein